MQPWRTIESIATSEGRLELRQRGARSFLITIGGRVLMTSDAHRSENALAQLACQPLAGRPRPRVLIGGLGMAFTLRAALDLLPRAARVTVVDLNRHVVAWVKGPLAALTAGSIEDPRVKTVVADVARVIADAPAGSYDAIVLDLYEGPHQANNRASDPLYGLAALERTRAALTPTGLVAIWSEERDLPFEARLAAAGFRVERHPGGRGGRAHVIYIGHPTRRPGPGPAATPGKRPR
jgi:spermidine synthase